MRTKTLPFNVLHLGTYPGPSINFTDLFYQKGGYVGFVVENGDLMIYKLVEGSITAGITKDGFYFVELPSPETTNRLVSNGPASLNQIQNLKAVIDQLAAYPTINAVVGSGIGGVVGDVKGSTTGIIGNGLLSMVPQTVDNFSRALWFADLSNAAFDASFAGVPFNLKRAVWRLEILIPTPPGTYAPGTLLPIQITVDQPDINNTPYVVIGRVGFTGPDIFSATIDIECMTTSNLVNIPFDVNVWFNWTFMHSPSAPFQIIRNLLSYNSN